MRDYSLLFGLAALGLIVGCQQAPSPQRSAELPKVPPSASNSKVGPDKFPGDATK
jgi:hypothetical protein